MRRSLFVTALVVGLIMAGAWTNWWRNGGTGADTAPESPIQPSAGETSADTATEQPKLPENDPPEGLSITKSGQRDHFPVLRKPWLVESRLGDTMLAPDEPVLGIALGNEAHAYSTNQLNAHEMVVDEIGSTPILVTY